MATEAKDLGAVLDEALRYERKIRELYGEAAAATKQAEARAFYKNLERDEASHVAYLEHKKAQWTKEGKVAFEPLGSPLPSPAAFEAAVARSGASLAGHDIGGREEALARALKAEEETTDFYKSLVGKVGGEAEKIFARFLEIEEGHSRIVRAELDLATRTGHWFDIREFDLED